MRQILISIAKYKLRAPIWWDLEDFDDSDGQARVQEIEILFSSPVMSFGRAIRFQNQL